MTYLLMDVMRDCPWLNFGTTEGGGFFRQHLKGLKELSMSQKESVFQK